LNGDHGSRGSSSWRAAARFAVLLGAFSACGGRTQLEDDAALGAGGGASGTPSVSGASGNNNGVAGGGADSGGAGAGGAAGLNSGGNAGLAGALNPTQALCAGPSNFETHEAVDVWTDSAGAFVRIDSRVFANVGAGWSLLSEQKGGGVGGLSGFIGGPLLFYGSFGGCGINLVQRSGSSSCSGAAEVVHVHVVRQNLAHAVYGGRILSYDGAFWIQRGDALGDNAQVGARQVWANENTLVVAARSGVYVARGGGKPQRQVELEPSDGSEPDFTAVWGFSDELLWVGNRKGELFEFDGKRWQLRREAQAGECAQIRRLWGSQGRLFVASENQVFSANVGAWQAILTLPCEQASRVWGLWGNAADDLLIAYETGASNTECGDIRVNHYDGTRLTPR